MTTAETDTTNSEAATQDTPVSLALQDLQIAARIIDVAVSRGAFRANEATQVGQVFDKLNSFIESVAPKQEEETQEE